jgi:hypothetical protein
MYRYIKGIPNMMEFYLKDKVIDNFALTVFDILRNKESRFVKVHGTKRLSNANKYLDRQFARLYKYAKAGEVKKFNYLARKLMMKSVVFRFYAIKFVFPKLLRANTVKAVNICRRVKALCLSESTELKYKRVWITDPGKSDTYTRPLGVPTAEWRIYGHMLTKIMEVYLDGRGYLTRNQHGGKARFGVMSFLRVLGGVLRNTPAMLEFDIKGFFNNVSHESMLELLEGLYLKEQMSKILKCKPVSYQLPPVEEDKSVREWIEPQEEHPDQKDYPEFNLNKMAHLFSQNHFMNLMYPKGSPIITGIPKPWAYGTIGSSIDGTGASFGRLTPRTSGAVMPTEAERAVGRDRMKGLGEENRGVPQGTAFGPLLASSVLGYNTRNLNSLIYMDDGIILCKSETEANKAERILTNKLKRIGCELAPDKTRVLRTRELISTGIKLLGTRWKQTEIGAKLWHGTRSIFTYRAESETRRGISKPFLNVSIDEFRKVVEEFRKAGFISFSKDQVFWRELGTSSVPRDGTYNRKTYDIYKDIFDDELLNLAVKHEIFGSILAKAYSPEESIASMVEAIQYGIFKAEAKLARYPWNTIEKKLYRKYIAKYINEEGAQCTTRITMQNVSTLSNDIFLSFLNKDLSVRSKLIYNFYPIRVRKAVVKRIVNSNLQVPATFTIKREGK